MRVIRAAFASCLFLLASAASGDQDALNYLYEPAMPEEYENLLGRMMVHARNAEFEDAINVSQTIVDGAEPLQQNDPTTYGMILTNHGILFTAAGDYELGLSILESASAYLELRTNPFSTEWMNHIMATALAESGLGNLTDAEDTFRRAQHITHRQNGVYSPDQISIINYITANHLKSGRVIAADREQRFTLRISEQEFGPDSPEMLPILTRLGSYFATRGSTMPVALPAEIRLRRDLLFKDSVNMYERAISIIEDQYGNMDLRLLGPLRGMASARLLQVTNRKYAENALQRAMAIVNANPDSDVGDQARALIDIGDLYVITSDRKASQYYLQAWNLLQDSEETRLAATQFFSTPTRLHPRRDDVLYLERKPDAAKNGEELFAELQYTVSAQGKVQHVQILDKNVPNEQVRILRGRLRATRFRPRIIDGEILPTEGLILNQKYHLLSEASLIPDDPDAPIKGNMESGYVDWAEQTCSGSGCAGR